MKKSFSAILALLLLIAAAVPAGASESDNDAITIKETLIRYCDVFFYEVNGTYYAETDVIYNSQELHILAGVDNEKVKGIETKVNENGKTYNCILKIEELSDYISEIRIPDDYKASATRYYNGAISDTIEPDYTVVFTDGKEVSIESDSSYDIEINGRTYSVTENYNYETKRMEYGIAGRYFVPVGKVECVYNNPSARDNFDALKTNLEQIITSTTVRIKDDIKDRSFTRIYYLLMLCEKNILAELLAFSKCIMKEATAF